MKYKAEKMETPWGVDSLFSGKDNSGSGILHTSEKGEEVRAQAVVSPELMLSKIAGGFDEKKAGLLNGEARPLVNAICLSYLGRKKASCEDERKKVELDTQARQLTLAGVRAELVEACFKRVFRRRGASGVQDLANLIETVERKSRTLTAKEKRFIRSLEEAAKKAKGVPYNKDVLKEWLGVDSEESADTFYTVKRRLGFGWLPQWKG